MYVRAANYIIEPLLNEADWHVSHICSALVPQHVSHICVHGGGTNVDAVETYGLSCGQSAEHR